MPVTVAATAAAVAIGRDGSRPLLKREVEGARKDALCGGPPCATWRHHLQKSALSSYARRPPLLWTSGRDPPLVARRRHASTASPSQVFVSAVSRPTRPTASGDCQLHPSRPGMFQCRSQSPGREAPCRRTCLPVSCYTRLLVLSRHTVRGTSNKSIEGCVVTDCKRRPSGGLPGRGRPCPLGPRDEPRPLS